MSEFDESNHALDDANAERKASIIAKLDTLNDQDMANLNRLLSLISPERGVSEACVAYLDDNPDTLIVSRSRTKLYASTLARRADRRTDEGKVAARVSRELTSAEMVMETYYPHIIALR